MINHKQLKHLLLGMSLTLAACGGGGGGETQQAVTYSGITSQATVTSSNAEALSVDAYEGGQIGSTMSVVGVVTEGSAAQPDSSRLQWLGATLKAAARQAVATPAGHGSPSLIGAMSEATEYGVISGSMSYSVSVNEGSGAFSGTITFNNYSNSISGGSLTGSVSFSGLYDQVTEGFTDFVITINSFKVTEGDYSAWVYGTVSLSSTSTDETIKMSLVLKNGMTGKTYWVKDFIYTESYTGLSTLTGTFYDPFHGYVTIETVTPMTVAMEGALPTAGQLLFWGANGTKARLTFTTTGYTLEVYQVDTGMYAILQ